MSEYQQFTTQFRLWISSHELGYVKVLRHRFFMFLKHSSCCCSETPSTQDYFYPHFIQKLFSKKARGGGRTRLPKFKFSTKFPIGLRVILELQIKKIKICSNQMRKIILIESLSGCSLVPKNSFKQWTLIRQYVRY